MVGASGDGVRTRSLQSTQSNPKQCQDLHPSQMMDIDGRERWCYEDTLVAGANKQRNPATSSPSSTMVGAENGSDGVRAHSMQRRARQPSDHTYSLKPWLTPGGRDNGVRTRSLQGTTTTQRQDLQAKDVVHADGRER